MITTVRQKNIQLSPQKAGLICDLIKNKNIKNAIDILNNLEKKGAKIIGKLLKSAIANATNNHNLDPNLLYVYKITADKDKFIKRMLPRAKGSSNVIKKRRSIITIVLSDDKNQKKIDAEQIKLNMKKRVNSKKTNINNVNQINEEVNKKSSIEIENLNINAQENKPLMESIENAVELEKELEIEGKEDK